MNELQTTAKNITAPQAITEELCSLFIAFVGAKSKIIETYTRALRGLSDNADIRS